MRQRKALWGMLLALSVTPVQADWDQFWHGVHVDYARNSCWPHPFKETSAAQTREHFVVAVNNGWRAHNCLGDELFRDGDQWLTYAGRDRLRRIVQTNPEERRVVFVYRGNSHQATEARLAVVRQSISEMDLQGPQPSVIVTDVPPPTSSGNWMTQIQRKRVENLPPPILPAQDGESGSSGGGESQ